MRITGGTLRGRNLKAPDGMGTRPTSDRVREALFNLLLHHDWGEGLQEPLKDCIVIDAFGGTGALGLEALSRGASQTIFFEKDRKALITLYENIRTLGVTDTAKVIGGDVTKPPPARLQASLVFLDPPYRKGLIAPALQALAAQGWLAQPCLIITETSKSEPDPLPEGYTQILTRAYGDTVLGFYARPIS